TANARTRVYLRMRTSSVRVSRLVAPEGDGDLILGRRGEVLGAVLPDAAEVADLQGVAVEGVEAPEDQPVALGERERLRAGRRVQDDGHGVQCPPSRAVVRPLVAADDGLVEG